MHNKSVSAVTSMSFPPNERKMSNMLPSLIRKSKGGTVCQLVLPLPRACKKPREALGGARADPMGKRLHGKSDICNKLLVEVDMLVYIYPAYHPLHTYYNA